MVAADKKPSVEAKLVVEIDISGITKSIVHEFNDPKHEANLKIGGIAAPLETHHFGR